MFHLRILSSITEIYKWWLNKTYFNTVWNTAMLSSIVLLIVHCTSSLNIPRFASAYYYGLMAWSHILLPWKLDRFLYFGPLWKRSLGFWLRTILRSPVTIWPHGEYRNLESQHLKYPKFKQITRIKSVYFPPFTQLFLTINWNVDSLVFIYSILC